VIKAAVKSKNGKPLIDESSTHNIESDIEAYIKASVIKGLTSKDKHFKQRIKLYLIKIIIS
jgi:Cdc6-like AAA superfamily ATPase